ncbi:DUF58 domain-containing protein [Halobacteriales archaeon QH_2_65_14]|nr:MAG: DUF58 domain-containing protein [Halobacteriales archaeon QH_2_65_14]
MKLTPRGRAAAAIVVVAVFMGWQFGSRSLNAIAAPTLAALVGSAIIVYRADPPTVELSSVEAGYSGDSRTLTVSVTGSGLTVLYSLGPPTVKQLGPLGLVERGVNVGGMTEVVVYPRRYALSGNTILSPFFFDALKAERQEFERLREYRPGDPLRHIHWKSSAKHDEFLVMEFAPSERSETITIVGTAPRGEVDEMARLAATIADLALDAGFNVELAVPDGDLAPGQGPGHREDVLRLLARTTAGSVAPIDAAAADVAIRFGQRNLVVRLADTEYQVQELLERTGEGEQFVDSRKGRDDHDGGDSDGKETDDRTDDGLPESVEMLGGDEEVTT